MSLGGGEASTAVVVYGPDGKAYGSPAQARAAGVSNPTMSPPADVPISYPGRQPYTPAPMPSIPTQSSGGRNRYAEIMAQYAQSQPYSFTSMPPSYTGGFTPYTPQSAAPVTRYEEIMAQPAMGGGGGYSNSPEGRAEREAYFRDMDPDALARHLATNQAIAEGLDFLGKSVVPFGFLGSNDNEGQNSTGGPSRMTSPAAVNAERAMQEAIAKANIEGKGFVANPMSFDPAQQAQQAPAPAPAPVQTITAREIYRGDLGVPEGDWKSRSLGRGEKEYFRDVDVPVDRFTDSQGNFDFSALARAGIFIPGIGGGQGSSGGGYTVGGYAPGSQAAAAAASGTVGGYGPGTPGFNPGMTGLAKGGYVSMQHLGGPDPKGPDDGYAALKDGEFVINDKAVKKYGIELMNAINSGKISKGKLRGLLEM